MIIWIHFRPAEGAFIFTYLLTYYGKKCKKCGTLGHNSRTCKGKTAADRKLPKGSNKARKQRKTKESPTVLTQCSQAPQTQE